MPGKKRYFREKDLFRLTGDLNNSNNPRNNHRKFEEFNRTKYIPIHKQLAISSKKDAEVFYLKNSFNEKEKELRPVEDYKNLATYLKKTNTATYTNPELRQEIKNNISGLLDRINSNIDLNKYNQKDTKALFDKTIELKYTPLTLYNSKNENESTKFKNSIKAKLQSMSQINRQAKQKALEKLQNVKAENKVFLPNLTAEQKENMRNFSVYEDFNKFNSPTRREYTIKRGEKISHRRNIKDVNSLFHTSKYNSTRHKDIFCERYTTNDGLLSKIKSETDMKICFK